MLIQYKVILFIILQSFTIFSIFPQTQDNLNSDEEHITSLINKAKDYYEINPDSCLILGKQAYNLSIKNNYNKGVADALYWQAKAYYKTGEYEKAVKFSFHAIENYKSLNDTIYIAKSYSNAGLSYSYLNKYDSALYCQQKCLDYYLLTDNKKSIAIAYNNIGSAQINLGNYKDAIYAFTKSMELFEQIDFETGVGSCMLNIGQIYDRMAGRSDTILNNKALEYYYKAHDIYQKINDLNKLGETYNAIGIQFNQKANIYEQILKTEKDTIEKHRIITIINNYYKKAIDNYLKAHSIFTKTGNSLGVAQVTNNIGTIYSNQGKYDKALVYLEKALKINEDLNNREEIATNCLSIAECYRKTNNYDKALKYADKGYEKVMEVNTPTLYQDYYYQYYMLHKDLGYYNKALSYFEKYSSVKDSLLRADNLTTINEVQALYENEIKTKKIQLTEAIAKKRQQQIYGFALLALLLMILAIVIWRNLLNKKKINAELQHKNKLILAQKQEITDSIKYASRIQNAVLPPDEYVKKLFPDYFILFKPLHIVSGDFYWMKKLEHANVIIATAADCTGHGVPGAFMSMLGIAFLNEIVNKPEIHSASAILDELKTYIIQSLHQTNNVEIQNNRLGTVRDGMDISLITWHINDNYIEFAGANNPLYLVRNGILAEYKGDKMPIGVHTKNDLFTNNKIEIKPGDCIYLFSDGYADQFGGPKGKKFKYKQLKEKLVSISQKPMEEQKLILDNTIINWMSYNNPENNLGYNQIDDIVIIGIKF